MWLDNSNAPGLWLFPSVTQNTPFCGCFTLGQVLRSNSQCVLYYVTDLLSDPDVAVVPKNTGEMDSQEDYGSSFIFQFIFSIPVCVM